MDILLATGNEGKVRELRALLGDQYIVHSLKEFPGFPEVVEDGETFAENALKKARAAAVIANMVALADDSGIEVDFLGGAPGVHSARFAGEEKDDQKNNERLLKELEGLEPSERTARFKSVIAIAAPGGDKFELAEGVCEGLVGFEPKGSGGFGYDPLFIVPEFNQTFAEIDLETKNKISHRGRALVKAKELLPRFFEGE